MKPCCGQPRQRSPKAIPDHAHFFTCIARRKFNRGLNVGKRLIDIELRNQAHRCLHVGAFVAQLDARLNAIEQRRRNGQESVPGIAVGYGTNVRVDAEDLLHHHQCRNRLAVRPSHICAQFLSVQRAQRYIFAHLEILPDRRFDTCTDTSIARQTTGFNLEGWELNGWASCVSELQFTVGGSIRGFCGPSSSRTSVSPRMQRSKRSESRAKSGASCSYSNRLNWLTMK